MYHSCGPRPIVWTVPAARAIIFAVGLGKTARAAVAAGASDPLRPGPRTAKLVLDDRSVAALM